MATKAELREQARSLGVEFDPATTSNELRHRISVAVNRGQVAEVVATPEQRAAFLQLLADEPGIGHVIALRRVGVCGTKGQLREWLDRQDIRDELEDATASPIRRELIRRAIEGVEEPVYGRVAKDQDGIVGTKIVYSDALLVKAFHAYTPEGRETSTARGRLEVSGPGGAAIPVEVNGGRATSLGDVLQLARELGVGLGAGLADGARGAVDTGPARDALPAAPDVLPDPQNG